PPAPRSGVTGDPEPSPGFLRRPAARGQTGAYGGGGGPPVPAPARPRAPEWSAMIGIGGGRGGGGGGGVGGVLGARGGAGGPPGRAGRAQPGAGPPRGRIGFVRQFWPARPVAPPPGRAHDRKCKVLQGRGKFGRPRTAPRRPTNLLQTGDGSAGVPVASPTPAADNCAMHPLQQVLDCGIVAVLRAPDGAALADACAAL